MLHSDPWHTHRTKEWTNAKGEQAGCHIGRVLPPQRQKGRCVTARPRKQEAAAIVAPETASSTKLWAGCQLLTTSPWVTSRFTSARSVTGRDQLPTGDTWHAWDCAPMASGKLSSRGRGSVEDARTLGMGCSTNTQSPELLGPGKSTKCTAHRDLCPCGASENLSSLELGSARTQCPLGTVPLQSVLEPEQCGPAKYMLPWAVANPVWTIHCEHPPHVPAVFVCSVPPSPQHSWTSEPKWVAMSAPLCQGRG